MSRIDFGLSLYSSTDVREMTRSERIFEICPRICPWTPSVKMVSSVSWERLSKGRTATEGRGS
jgi:hypothetical protein